MSAKAMTLRLPIKAMAELHALASIEERSVNAIVNEAIDDHIEARFRDRGFRRAFSERLAFMERMLDRRGRS